MKILWFSPTAANFDTKHYFGGWIASLENEMKVFPDITLGIAFMHPDTRFKVIAEAVTYYPMKRDSGFVARVKRFFTFSGEDKKKLDLCMKVVEDFKPDLIQIFGTESCFGLIAGETNIPVVIHLQGLMNPCINAWCPPFYSKADYFLSLGISPINILLRIWAFKFNSYSARREMEIMKKCCYFIGRTKWDQAFCSLYAPDSTYYHCDEILRNVFYDKDGRQAPDIPTLISTISGPLYKGHDMILKTAKLLTALDLRFRWKVFGTDTLGFAERKTGIRCRDVGIEVCGVVPADRLKQELLNSTAFVHPSYIDNSPNSICEAQILGIPVIATNVGGVSSIVKDEVTGLLVPANDPMMMAASITRLLNNPTLARKLASNAAEVASKRHSPSEIRNQLLAIYSQILSIQQ
jgi:glycosyltransferase involved in cell wall biosynthesis